MRRLIFMWLVASGRIRLFALRIPAGGQKAVFLCPEKAVFWCLFHRKWVLFCHFILFFHWDGLQKSVLEVFIRYTRMSLSRIFQKRTKGRCPLSLCFWNPIIHYSKNQKFHRIDLKKSSENRKKWFFGQNLHIPNSNRYWVAFWKNRVFSWVGGLG